jgi:histidinol-phosphate/aromatic aminotransferase/cobyric acid decarboxylase-like protein
MQESTVEESGAEGVDAGEGDLFGLLSLNEHFVQELLARGSRVFISDWDGSHPYAAQYLDYLQRISRPPWDLTAYAPMECTDLVAGIRSLHEKFDEGSLEGVDVLVGDGSTALLSAFCLWLTDHDLHDVYYIPPLHWGIAHQLKILRKRPHSVSALHAFEDGFSMRLPARKSVLFLSDPVWYAGRRLTGEQVRILRDWQERTGSLILVDGTFQYLQWDGSRRERTVDLAPDRTFRLVCPTKYLLINGFRCAYLLLPQAHGSELNRLYDSMHGAPAVPNLMFAERVVEIMRTAEGNMPLVRHAIANYERIVATGALGDHIPPECGYFVFGRVDVPADRILALDQAHFELSGYPDWVRVNLLNQRVMELLTAG